jgi:hypothetical protein
MTPEQRATRALFGDPDYQVQNPDKDFIWGSTWITWNELVAQYRSEEKSK